MTESLQGLRIALVATDGVGQAELEASGEVVRQAGAQTQLLSLRAGHIKSLDEDLEPGRTYTVDQTVAQATVEDYDGLLLVPGRVKSERLSSEDVVVSFVRDFIAAAKPVAVVCYGAWTLLEAGVTWGQRLPLSVTMRVRRKTGASLLTDELVSPHERRTLYSTIVREFARLLRPPASASAEATELAWTRVATSLPQPCFEKYTGTE
jgi:protease I